ncbi:alpha/beta hydrolase family protein [Glutamicibacter sp. X7]
MATETTIEFDEGALSALIDHPEQTAWATMVLAHGSGAGKDHPFMRGYAQAMAGQGVRVLSFNFPYMDAGKKFPDRAPKAIATWHLVMSWARERFAGPLVAAGKSYGGRMASLAVAEGLSADALVFLGYPWHAPKTPEKIRAEHLPELSVPMLFLQGTKDPFAQSSLLPQTLAQLPENSVVHWVEGGDHSFKAARSGRSVAEDGAQLATPSVDFLRR